MLERGKMDRDVVEIVGIDGLVPKDHLLRKIDQAVDFNRLYEMVEPLYCEDNGRPSIDPVVLFKMVLIQHLYGFPSLRRTADEISGSIYYRWFLGYTLQEETPHFSTVSYNFRHRFTEETVDQVFRWILEEVAEAGYLSPKAVFIDGTHIKANANTKKQVKVRIPAASRHYAKELMEEVNADRELHGKKPFVSGLLCRSQWLVIIVKGFLAMDLPVCVYLFHQFLGVMPGCHRNLNLHLFFVLALALICVPSIKTALGERYPACATSSRIQRNTWSTVSSVKRCRKL